MWNDRRGLSKQPLSGRRGFVLSLWCASICMACGGDEAGDAAGIEPDAADGVGDGSGADVLSDVPDGTDVTDPSDTDAADADGSPLPVERNACGGLEPLAYAGQPAEPGIACGDLGEGVLVCNGTNALRCAQTAAPNSCGGSGELPAEPGTGCGCGGEVVCADDGGVVCLGGTQTNVCGGCSELEGRPGFFCETDEADGLYVCQSAERLSCTVGAGNACGGADPLLVDGVPTPDAEPGAACDTGVCGPGRYVCDGMAALVCESDRPCNACGGSGPLAGTPGELCGLCGGGEWTCEGPDQVECNGSPRPNVCGTCGVLAALPGGVCTVVGGESDGSAGVVLCGDGATVCSPIRQPGAHAGSAELTLNECGGTSALLVPPGLSGAGESARLGSSCGACGEGELVCDGVNAVRCSTTDADQRNACDGCATLGGRVNSPCGTCGTGRLACDGIDELTCSGDLGAPAALNACGGCGALPGVEGDACGTCLAWACASTRLECTPTTEGVGCGDAVTCADLQCADEDRACTETDGTADATCGACLAGFTEGTDDACEPITCGALTPPANGSVLTPTGTTLNASANYRCDSGYTLVGIATRVCGTDGSWSGTEPVCEAVDCGALPAPLNGSVNSPEGTRSGATATYACASGYTVVGARTSICQATGVWSGSPPTCAPVDCGPLTAPTNGNVGTPTGTQLGAVASYSCATGYTLAGNTSRTCQETGSWSATAPLCDPVDCGSLTSPVNGTVRTPAGTTLGATATYVCSTGYELAGNETRTCESSGLWSGPPASCRPVDCGEPPSVAASNAAFTLTTFGATVSYTCNGGYDAVGVTTITCSASGEWSAPPSCTDVNECEERDVCSGLANECENTTGSWVCSCGSGYSGTPATGSNARCLGDLSSSCNVDADCTAGSWCPTNTLAALRRCSPREFSGTSNRMDFVLVPSGTFEQGTPDAADDERPYTATITRNYWASRTEITQGQWRVASGTTNPSCFQSTSGTECTTSNANNSGPVTNVDWYSALAYANWLSNRMGLQQCYTLSACESSTGWYDGDHAGCTGATFVGPDCTGYRLPTESEWERAARGGTTSTYHWGEETVTTTSGQYAWFTGNAGNRTQTVGTKLPNAYGLFDMSGNVAEWVWDRVGSITLAFPFPEIVVFSYPSSSASDYLGPGTAGSPGVRGGRYTSSVTSLRSADRVVVSSTTQSSTYGIRLIRTAE